MLDQDRVPSSLRSLLALAAGAAAVGIPSAQAAIHYAALNATVNWLNATCTIDLPGSADLTVNFSHNSTSNRIVAAMGAYGSVARQSFSRTGTLGMNVAHRTGDGVNWDNASGKTGEDSFGNIIRSFGSISGSWYLSGPGDFADQYLLFRFTNTTAGNQLQYGWVKLSGAIIPGAYENMSVTISGWAYDDTGAAINAGATTRVAMQDFYLRVENGTPTVRWETFSEEETVGFDLFRWADGAWVKVNGELIRAGGVDGMGAAYAVADAGANEADAFRYKLLEYETDGGTREYGFDDVAAGNPRLKNMEATADGVVLRWLSREQDTYEVQKSTGMQEGFVPLATDVPATPPVNEFRDPAQSGKGAFYRIRVK